MCFGLQGDNTLDILHLEIIACTLILWSKLLNHRALCKSNIIFVCRENFVRILLRGFLNHGKEWTLHFLTIDNECATENLVTAMLRVDLCKAENLWVSQRTTILLLQTVQILYLLWAQGKAFLLVIFLQIIHILNGLRLDVDSKDVLIQSIIHALQHLVVLGILVCNGEILFYTQNAAESHVLSNLNGICRPWSHHFAAWSDIKTVECLTGKQFCFAIEPAKFVYFFLIELMVHLRSNNALLWGLEKENHVLYTFNLYEFVCKGTNKRAKNQIFHFSLFTFHFICVSLHPSNH